MTPLARQLRWLIGIRLVVITSVVLPNFLLQLARASSGAKLLQEGDDFLYLLAGITYLASLIYIALLRLLEQQTTTQAYIQFLGDLFLVTGLVYYFGGIASTFSILYLVIIAVASTLLRRRAGFLVASAAYVLYASLIVGLFKGWLPNPPGLPPDETVSVWRVTYNLAVHLFGFYCTAILSSYLIRNITRAERELEEKKEDLADLQVVHRDLIQSMSSGLITTDLAGTVTSMNRAGEEILDAPEESLVGRGVWESPLFTAAQWEHFRVAGGREGNFRAEVEHRRGDETRYLGFSISRLNDSEGAHKGYIVIFQDLTLWRKLQEEVRIKDRMAAVGELAAGIAHEIGNPLAAISGSVQMLSASVAGKPSASKLLEILLKESQRLDRTVKGFLRFARPKDRSAAAFDIAKLLSENFELLSNSDEVSKGHRLTLDLQPESATLVADPDQISQIFWNLARNALRAMPEGGEMRVLGRVDGDCYRLQVVDTGRGMSDDERAKLFQPFQSFFDGGSGIGMAIVYRIVQEHGGRLVVNSTPGKGSTITVELPLAQEAAAVLPGES